MITRPRSAVHAGKSAPERIENSAGERRWERRNVQRLSTGRKPYEVWLGRAIGRERIMARAITTGEITVGVRIFVGRLLRPTDWFRSDQPPGSGGYPRGADSGKAKAWRRFAGAARGAGRQSAPF